MMNKEQGIIYIEDTFLYFLICLKWLKRFSTTKNAKHFDNFWITAQRFAKKRFLLRRNDKPLNNLNGLGNPFNPYNLWQKNLVNLCLRGKKKLILDC